MFYALAIALGYAAAIFTWPAVRTFLTGEAAEIESLRARVQKLMTPPAPPAPPASPAA